MFALLQRARQLGAKPAILTCLVTASLLPAGAVTASIPTAGRLVTGSAPQLRLLPRAAGQVTSFAFDPVDPDVVFAGTSLSLRTGRIYRSSDGGSHWQLSAGLSASVTALAADPQRPGTLYAATGIPVWTWPNGVPTFQGWKHVAVYRTADWGGSWQRWSRGLQAYSSQAAPGAGFGGLGQGWVTALAVDPGDDKVVYAGTGGGIEKSTDGGRSWRTVFSGSKFLGTWGLAITPARPQVIYAAALIDTSGRCSVPTSGVRAISRCDYSTLFYKSRDSGKTWRATDLRQVGLDGPAGIYRGHGPYYRIVKSTDSGRTWTVTG